ncbi:MAG: hypothetical protein NC489_32120 [Ruminococcus flavefaciens]|nr:hypothetical protein [Ruminococcus flavefaciens]
MKGKVIQLITDIIELYVIYMKLSKGIVQVIFANILNLMISIGNGFLLPKYLSIEAYADLKAFLLYTSYVGILHFGYVDGIYIKYGGRTIDTIDTEKFANEKRVLFLFQFTVTLPIVLIAILIDNTNLLFAAISILPINMVLFFKFIYQATGEFKEYRYITNLGSILIFILNLLSLFIIKTDISLWYIGIQVVISFVVWIYYEGKNRTINICNKCSLEEVWNCLSENIHLGIIIMLGNFMGVWITSIDRWFVKILYSVADFAYYSFAVTMLRLINVVVTAFSVTLYNFFCKKPKDQEVDILRKIVLVVGAIIIAIIFPLEFIIRTYLEKYIYALPVIKVLFMAQFVLIAVNAVYLNLYKARNLQKKYLIRMIVVTVTAFFLNGMIGYMWNDIMAYAAATFLTAFVWLILCQIDLPEYKMKVNEWIYVLMALVSYFVSNRFNYWIGMGNYICLIMVITVLLFQKDFKRLLRSIGEKE